MHEQELRIEELVYLLKDAKLWKETLLENKVDALNSSVEAKLDEMMKVRAQQQDVDRVAVMTSRIAHLEVRLNHLKSIHSFTDQPTDWLTQAHA